MIRRFIFSVYILTNRKNGAIYIDVTNNLENKILQQKNGISDGFTKRYSITRLVYFESFNNINNAIKREKQMKGESRSRKIALIEKENKEWMDLYDVYLNSTDDFQYQ